MEAGILDEGGREESFRDGQRKFSYNGLISFFSFLLKASRAGKGKILGDATNFGWYSGAPTVGKKSHSLRTFGG